MSGPRAFDPAAATQGATLGRESAGDEARAWMLTVLAVTALWGLFHYYAGIVHDSQLYSLQALRVLEPAIFGDELNFRFGSQDDFTLFSKLYAPLVGALGLPAAAKLLTALGQVLWVAGAILLARRFFGHPFRAGAALIFAVAMPAYYGGLDILRFGEGFLTPRLFAEAATLWSLWLVASRRPVAAFGVVVAAAALHPIYGAVGLGALVFYLCQSDRRWLLLVPAGAALALAAAFAGVSPIDRLFETYDAAWFEVVRVRNSMVLVSEWESLDWARLAMSTCVLTAAAVLRAGIWRRMSIAVLATAAAGVLGNALGVDLLHNVLVTQLQLFRATWLLQLFAHLALGLLLYELWRHRTNAGAISALLAASLIGVWLLPWAGLVIGVATVALATVQIRRNLPAFSRWAAWAAFGTLGITLFVMLPGRYLAAVQLIEELERAAFHWSAVFSLLVLTESLLFGSLALLLLFISMERQGRPGRLTLAVVLLAAAVSLAFWDRRPEFKKTMEAADAPASLVARIPPRATVLTEGHSDVAWFYLRRRSYLARHHGSSALFSRPLAMEFARRAKALAPLEMPYLLHIAVRVTPEEMKVGTIGHSALRSACENAAGLDYMLLHRKVEGAYEGRWVLREGGSASAVENGGFPPTNVVYLYDCDRIRGDTR